jgi:hypothetical protein
MDISPALAGQAIKSAFSLDQKFFVGLRERLESARNRENEKHLSITNWLRSAIKPPDGYSVELTAPDILYPPEAIPSVEQLAHLVLTAFWASLEKEEGRPLRFTVNFMSPEPSSERLIAFDGPLPYEGRELIKLAPAVGTTEAALLVAAFERDGLKIWGIRDHSFSPLRIKAIDPGVIIVKFKDRNVAAISRSEAVHIRDPLLTRSSVIWSRFGGNEEGKDYDQWSDPRINAILETVKRMRSLGHGGTLMIVPAESGYRRSLKIPITYSGARLFSPFQQSIPPLRELKKTTGYTWADEMYLWTMITNTCKMLSQLTAVDGAAVVTYDLDVVGFGVKLQPPTESAEPRQIFSVDPLDHPHWITEVKLAQLGGMRHQSAARFVADQKDAIAFVVSQDGDVSAYVWYLNPSGSPGLYAHRRLELTLF